MSYRECDLAIPDVKTGDDEYHAAKTLRSLPGIEDTRVLPGAAWLVYRPEAISREQICRALDLAGFPPAGRARDR